MGVSSVDPGGWSERTVAVIRHVREGVKLKFRHLFRCRGGNEIKVEEKEDKVGGKDV